MTRQGQGTFTRLVGGGKEHQGTSMFGVLNSILISMNFSFLLLRRRAKIRNLSTNAIFASGKLAHTQNCVKTPKIYIHREDFNELKYASFKKSAPIYQNTASFSELAWTAYQ